MRIIVTGGAGLIGSHLCDALLEKQHEVVAVDNLSKGSMDNLSVAQQFAGFSFVEDDVRNPDLYKRFGDGADVVVHLAAFKIPRYGNRIDTLTINTKGSYHTFEIASKFHAKLVFASTSDIYGKNEKAPLGEEDEALFPGPEISRWAYAVSKFYEEHLGFAFAEKYDIPVVCMRFFATYGPRQHRSWWGGPTPVFIEKVLSGEPITVHGDGKQTRSFCFVSDTVDGIVRCVENDKANNQVWNIGNPNTVIAIDDYARLVQQLVDPHAEPNLEYIPYNTFGRYEDITQRVPDISKITAELGYQPKVGLEDGLRQTIAWQAPLHGSDV